jgi:hypothetical protein
MITLPIKFLRVLSVAVISLRKAKAFNANMFRHVGIGHREDVIIHDELSQLDDQIQNLLVEARREKRKNFVISIYPVDFE